MTRREDKPLAEEHESDGETEDEEVKRTCIMGESGMRDSDFSDSDSDTEEMSDTSIRDETIETSDGVESTIDRMVDLVKFVNHRPTTSFYRPTPVAPSLVLHEERSEENDNISNASDLKSESFSPIFSNPRSGFSPRLKLENEIEIHIGRNANDSESESINSGSVESDESISDMESTSFDFTFDREERLSIEIESADTNSSLSIAESCCKLSPDGQQEAQESISADYALVGASGATVDDKWSMTKSKRVLSSNTLSALNEEAERNLDRSKKVRLCQQISNDASTIPEISPGVAVLDQEIQPLPRQYFIEDDTLMISAYDDDKEAEMLIEEHSILDCNRANLPIPLLTPPQSPRTVDEIIKGQVVTSIEWPSNLVMDRFANISPMSTISKRDEQIKSDSSSVLAIDDRSQRSLGPRLRTISVGTP